jgi:decaprenylphospho-beta-D-erythro-pentofuranosid-2-ulose 2-reductase
MKRIVIVGATSAIAQACARRWADAGGRFFLVARNETRLRQIADDIKARGGNAACWTLDIDDIAAHEPMWRAARENLGEVDIVLLAHGTLPDQPACAASVELSTREIQTNGLSTIALLTIIANSMEQQRSGTIAVISSVAGDRGRPSNYVYGAAKALVSTFCEGLRARLHRAGVNVLTIKPGFVATPMTAGLPLPAALVSSPERVASDIDAAIAGRSSVLYTAWFWRWIMLVIKLIPATIFRRLSL